jgi:hypothetical protein
MLFCLCLSAGVMFVNVAIAADGSCGIDPSIEKWTNRDKVEVADIWKQIPAEFQDLVRHLDALPINTSEKTLVAGVPYPLGNVVRLRPDAPLLEWDVVGKDPRNRILLRVMYWKGCIMDINFSATSNGVRGERYNRRTKFDKAFAN